MESLILWMLKPQNRIVAKITPQITPQQSAKFSAKLLIIVGCQIREFKCDLKYVTLFVKGEVQTAGVTFSVPGLPNVKMCIHKVSASHSCGGSYQCYSIHKLRVLSSSLEAMICRVSTGAAEVMRRIDILEGLYLKRLLFLIVSYRC